MIQICLISCLFALFTLVTLILVRNMGVWRMKKWLLVALINWVTLIIVLGCFEAYGGEHSIVVARNVVHLSEECLVPPVPDLAPPQEQTMAHVWGFYLFCAIPILIIVWFCERICSQKPGKPPKNPQPPYRTYGGIK